VEHCAHALAATAKTSTMPVNKLLMFISSHVTVATLEKTSHETRREPCKEEGEMRLVKIPSIQNKNRTVFIHRPVSVSTSFP
jgi:hypothetical protein